MYENTLSEGQHYDEEISIEASGQTPSVRMQQHD
jgi:hypothetical protein